MTIDRQRWLAERRAEVERSYTDEAPTYDEYDPATPVHRRFIAQLVAAVPPEGSILDAACGTAPYAGLVTGAGIQYVGVDQSRGMLEQARSKWPDVRFELIGLQEMTFEVAFDAVMCLDAMENVPPEDWPKVVSAFRRALRPDGYVYLTIETVEPSTLDEAWETATTEHWPVRFGEVVEGDTAGYHFYPDRRQVDSWLGAAGFRMVADEDEWLDGYGYRHLLLRLDQNTDQRS